MRIYRVNFPAILSENEEAYFRHLEGIISSNDTEAMVEVTRRHDGIAVRIVPSSNRAQVLLLQSVKRMHTLLGLNVEFSKSMRASSNIYFKINF